MSVTRKGWEKDISLSLLTAEATYDAAVAAGADKYTLMQGYAASVKPETADIFTDNAGEVHGAEIATDAEITEYRSKFTYESPKVQPHDLAGLGALAMGDETAAQDGATTAWQHYIKPVAVGTALKSISAIYDPANKKELYTGLKANTFNLSSEEAGHVALSSELMGSGRRVDSALALQSAKVETLLRATDTAVYLNPAPIPATDFVTPANMVQDDANIDGAVPALTALGDRVVSWAFNFSPNLQEQAGMGGVGYLQDLEVTARTMDVELVLRYKDETERDYYENLTDIALEFNNARVAAGLIDAAGAFFYGFILRIPKILLNVRPEADGAIGEPYTITLAGTILDDGTNEMFDLTVYNATEVYLA